MKEIEIVKIMNKATKYLKNENGENTGIYDRIENYLENEAFFYMLNKEDAIKLLITVGVHEKSLMNTYDKLVNKETYDDLISRNVISQDDEKVLIKF